MDPPNAATQALQDTDDYLLFDPRAGRSVRQPANRGRQTFAEAIVFVVGGGSYVEFTNLSEYAARSATGGAGGGGGGGGMSGGVPGLGQGRKITYGSTEIMPPGDFLKSLGNLARG